MLTCRHVSLRQRVWVVASAASIRGHQLVVSASRESLRWPIPSYGTRRLSAVSPLPDLSAEEAAEDEFEQAVRSVGRTTERSPQEKNESGLLYKAKLASHTPLVIAALSSRGYSAYELNALRGKIDFQYRSPFFHAVLQEKRQRLRRRTSEAKIRAQLSSPDVSLKSILARYIELLHGEDLETVSGQSLELALNKLAIVFNAEALACLESLGFSPVDVVSWAWILTAKSSFDAAARLHVISNRDLERNEASAPNFVLQMILLRKSITLKALRLLIIHAFDRVENTETKHWRLDLVHTRGFPLRVYRKLKKQYQTQCSSIAPLVSRRPHPGLTGTAITLLTIRLIRHARRTWPEALPYISRLFARNVTYHLYRRRVEQAKLAFIYNKLLRLLSLYSERFFAQIAYHQEAQFIIIRTMGEMNPPLLVDRTGYRSVITIQLARRKTDSETKWAQRKTRSWPPWQEPRHGLDEHISKESGVTRAGVALSQQAESGYSSTAWEDTASILAGWDTDNSPTIQTRRYLQPVTTMLPGPTTLSNASTWSARIHSTSTIEEAWSIFLSYEEESTPAEEPCVAMAEKLLLGSTRTRKTSEMWIGTSRARDTSLPGDNLEPFEPSQNPKERPYLSAAVPSIEQFLDHIERRGAVMGQNLLICILEHSCSYELGKDLLKRSNLSTRTVQTILGLNELKAVNINSMQPRLFLAVLRWYTANFSTSAITVLGQYDFPSSTICGADLESSMNRVLWAFQLVNVSQTTYPPHWSALFRALVPPLRKRVPRGLYQDAWSQATRLVAHMDNIEASRSWPIFNYMCRILYLVQYERAIETTRYNREDSVRRNDRRLGYDTGTELLKKEFESMVGTKLTDTAAAPKNADNVDDNDPNTDPPTFVSSLLRIPTFRDLHFLIQSLGMAEDSEGILQLMHWMKHHRASLYSSSDIISKDKHMRYCFIAIRVFMEGHCTCGDVQLPAAPKELIEAARDLLPSICGTDVWPSDEEVNQYLPCLAVAYVEPH